MRQGVITYDNFLPVNLIPHAMLEKINQTAEFLRSQVSDMPRIAIILGTGLGPLADMIEDKTVIPYSTIPNFPVSTVGHAGPFPLL